MDKSIYKLVIVGVLVACIGTFLTFSWGWVVELHNLRRDVAAMITDSLTGSEDTFDEMEKHHKAVWHELNVLRQQHEMPILMEPGQ